MVQNHLEWTECRRRQARGGAGKSRWWFKPSGRGEVFSHLSEARLGKVEASGVGGWLLTRGLIGLREGFSIGFLSVLWCFLGVF